MSQSTDFTAELLRPSVLHPTIPVRLVSSLLCITPCLFLPLCLAFPVLLTNDLLSSFLPLCLAFAVLLTNDLLSFLQFHLLLHYSCSYCSFSELPTATLYRQDHENLDINKMCKKKRKFRHHFEYSVFVLLAVTEETLLPTKIGSPFRKILVLCIILLSHPI